MKICLVSSVFPPTDLGGVAEVTYNLQKMLYKHGIEVYVISRGTGEENSEKGIIRLSGKKEFFAVRSFLLGKKLNLSDFDVVHFHDFGGLGILPYCKDIKKIFTLHTSLIETKNATRSLKIGGRIIRPNRQEILSKYVKLPIQIFGTSILCKSSNLVTSVSEKTKKECSVGYHIPENKIKVINNGVDISRFNSEASGDEIRERYNIGSRPVILYAGRLRILKGIYYLIFAMREVCRQSDALLLIAGAGEVKDDIRSLIQEFGLERNIVIAGEFQNKEIPKFYAAADIVVVPSIYEGFSLTALEAMASAKPVIVSDGCGVSDSIVSGKNGFIFEAGNVEKLIEKITLLLENSSLRESMGKAGRKTVKEKFDWRNIAFQYKNLYEKLIYS